MPFIVHILAEDIQQWEVYQHNLHTGPAYQREQEAAGHVHYRLKQTIYNPALDNIKVTTPAPLESLVDQDLFAFVNVEEGYLSKSTGAGHRTHIRLKRLNREIREPVRRLRLAIEKIDTTRHPPHVTLKETVTAVRTPDRSDLKGWNMKDSRKIEALDHATGLWEVITEMQVVVWSSGLLDALDFLDFRSSYGLRYFLRPVHTN